MKLNAKVILFFLALASASGGLIISLTWRSVGHAVIKNLTETGMAKAVDLASDNTESFLTQSEAALLPAIQDAQKVSHAEFVATLDTAGRVLAHTNVAEKGLVYADDLTVEILKDTHPGVRMIRRGGDKVLQVWAPVWSRQGEDTNEQFLLGGKTLGQTQRLGTVLLSLPTQEAVRTQTRIIREMSFIVFLIGTIALLCTLILMRRLLIPIRQLEEATARVAQGQYGIELPVGSKDELGNLARSFNAMSKVLNETTVSKKVLEESEERFRQLAESIDEVFWMTDLVKQKMVYISPSYEQIWGRLCETLYANPMSFVEAIHPDDRDRILKAIPEQAAGTYDVEYRVVRPDDSVRWIHDRAFPVSDASGKVYRVAGIAEDITKRKSLESIVRQSEKLSAVGQLAAGVAHEINNPLGVILGFAQAVVRRLQPNDPLEMPLKSIEKEAMRCKNLVQDLLTFSRVSKTDREPMDISRAVDGAFSLIMAQARMTHVDVRKDLAPDLPRFLGNLNQIQQVIINLANNALDAMGNSAGVLTVKTQMLTEDHIAWVCLSVIDNGPGVSETILSRIFDPFFTTKAVGKGTGLGLSLVHEIIKKHSGTINVHSKPGCTEFLVKFPVRQAPLAPLPGQGM